MALILAVDDDPMILDLYAEALAFLGHEVTTASSGHEALAKIKRRRFDLMILDIMMPGTNGYDVLDRLREMPTRAEMPVVVVTAKHDPKGVLREIELGAVDHLVKPFHTAELEETVTRALQAGSHREIRRSRVANDAAVYGSMTELVQGARDAVEA